MTYSKLTNKIIKTNNYSSRYGEKVTAICIHHCAGCVNLSGEQIINNIMTPRNGSANYVITTKGEIIGSVGEEFRPWTTGGIWDRNFITFELANCEVGEPWRISEATIKAAIKLTADICKRYNIKKLYYDGKRGTLMRHCDWAPTACPGSYFKSITEEFCQNVNKLLNDGEDKETKNYIVFSGSFLKRENAERQKAKLEEAGYNVYISKYGRFLRCQLGYFNSEKLADKMREKVLSDGFPCGILEV